MFVKCPAAAQAFIAGRACGSISLFHHSWKITRHHGLCCFFLPYIVCSGLSAKVAQQGGVGSYASFLRNLGGEATANGASEEEAAQPMMPCGPHPLRLPSLPGDIFVDGNLPKEVVEQLSTQCAGWLYVKSETDPHFMPEVIKSSGSNLQVLPLKLDSVPAGRVEEIVTSIQVLPYWRVSGALAQRPCVGDTVRDEAEVLKCVSYDTGSSTLSYLIACPETQQAVLIDPVLEQKDRDLALLAELGLKLKYVLNTHCHADHVTSGGSIRRDMPEVKTIISENSGGKAGLHIKHGDVVNFGNLALEVRATLGHTNGCVTYVLRTKMATFAFTGETLLIQGCGRTDFQQGSSRQLHESVHSRSSSCQETPFSAQSTTTRAAASPHLMRNAASTRGLRRLLRSSQTSWPT